MAEVASESRTLPTDPVQDPPCRRFTILDGMILIAGAALWLTLVLQLAAEFKKLGEGGWSGLGWAGAWRWFLAAPCTILFWGVIVLTPLFLIIRLRGPRLELRRLIWQPGMMACSIACLAWLVVFIAGSYEPGGVLCISGSVASAWLASWWSGRLRPEPGWIDRLGRVLGVCWILIAGYLRFVA